MQEVATVGIVVPLQRHDIGQPVGHGLDGVVVMAGGEELREDARGAWQAVSRADAGLHVADGGLSNAQGPK